MPEAQVHTYEFGHFRVDAAKRLLLGRDGQAVSLTPKAFDTLLYMVEHRAVVLDKEELLRAIWPDTVVEENNLTQNISTLRRALGETRTQHSYIVTVPGRGYRFVAEVRTRTMCREASVGTVKAVAVLPFMPLVEEHRDAALELGMADTLITRLSGIREVVVRPISSVRKYVDVDQDPLLAGHQLGVESVLEGSIQRWGDSIRVTVRLMNVSTGAALWAGTFDEKFTNIFFVQDAIATKVVDALALQLGYEEKRRLTRRYTENAEAYELYLKGSYHVNRLTPPEMQKGISYFYQATAIDPSYALAYLGLANAFLRIPVAGEMPSAEYYSNAKAAALKAIEIDDTLAGAHAALGWIIFWYEWIWSEAENEFRRALELDPNDADSHLGYAHLLSNTGRHAEGLAEVKRARELDPLNLLSNALEGQFLLHAGQTEEALIRLQNTLELEPYFWLARLFASSAYAEKGMFAEAVKQAWQARDFSGGSSHAMAFGSYALARSGKRSEARSVLEELLQLSSERYIPPYHLALAYNGLDEPDKTLACLERGHKERDPKMVFLKVEPKWDNLRRDPRFVDLMRRVGFAQ
jgi:DNA-binding winged helix-turn-helix (wHTH) protein/tetratricopeptide (TPR) repeat protein